MEGMTENESRPPAPFTYQLVAWEAFVRLGRCTDKRVTTWIGDLSDENQADDSSFGTGHQGQMATG